MACASSVTSMPASVASFERMAQLRKGKHLRRQCAPQSLAIHGGHVIAQLALDRVDDGCRQHRAVDGASRHPRHRARRRDRPHSDRAAPHRAPKSNRPPRRGQPMHPSRSPPNPADWRRRSSSAAWDSRASPQCPASERHPPPARPPPHAPAARPAARAATTPERWRRAAVHIALGKTPAVDAAKRAPRPAAGTMAHTRRAAGTLHSARAVTGGAGAAGAGVAAVTTW